MAYGKTIELFLVNGTADSLVIAELSNWNGKALKIPRIEVASCNRDDITQNTYRNTVMKESQVAVMEEFVDNVKVLINALGYKVLEPLVQASNNPLPPDGEELHISSGNVSAVGKVTAEGFVVLKGSKVNEKTSAKSLSPGMKKLRDKLFTDGTTEDILFSSSSAAADFILGYSVSGPKTWKAKDGRPLKEIRVKRSEERKVWHCTHWEICISAFRQISLWMLLERYGNAMNRRSKNM